MNFKTAVETISNSTTTDNGALSYRSTLNNCLDLFYTIGSKDNSSIIPLFEKAFKEDAIIATKIAMHARDIREGLGRRKHFRDILLYLEKTKPQYVLNILPNIPEIGRWDDLLIFKTKELKHAAYSMIEEALILKNSLCAKWMPRKGIIAIELRDYLKLTPKKYRKLLVELTSVVESKMCKKQWNNIEYNKVPSKAFNNYKRTFTKHDKERFNSFISDVNKGKTTLNASILYPHEVFEHNDSNSDVIRAQWAMLPNYIGNKKYLPIVDASASMYDFTINGVVGSYVAWALGLYCADKNTSPAFKDILFTFSAECKPIKLEGDIVAKYSQYYKAGKALTTNIMSVFTTLLNMGKDNNISKEDMPETIIIFSDMEFDNNRQITKPNKVAFEAIKELYEQSGYTIPNIVFWNLRNETKQTPLTKNDEGAVLVSGFSSNTFKQIGKLGEFDPIQLMFDTVFIERYAFKGVDNG